MARTIHRLSDRTVKAAKSGMHCDGGGLYLQAVEGAKGKDGKIPVHRSWLFRFATTETERNANSNLGRERQMGLGSFPDVSLAQARGKAAECRQLRREGKDPIAERDAQRVAAAADSAKAMTFDECAQRYISAHRASWRNPKHASQWKNTLTTYVSPAFGKLAVQAIDVGLVIKALEPIWATKPETASRVRGRIEAILNWATARGYRAGENPARWRGHLDKLLPARSKVRKVEHHAALPYQEAGGFMRELRTRDAVAARALEFAILTAARTGEVLGAQWEEIDFRAKVWTVPAGRMKGGREHRVPLSHAAVAVLERMAKVRENNHIFPGDRRAMLSNMAFLMLLRRMGRGDLTAHGFRSTFRDWAAERTNFPSEVVEMALAHVVSDKTEAAYRRGDLFEKRRRLMSAWAEFCTKPQARGTVVPLRADA